MRPYSAPSSFRLKPNGMATEWYAPFPLIKAVSNYAHSVFFRNSVCFLAFLSKLRPEYPSKCPPGSICNSFGSRALEYASRARSVGVRTSFSATVMSSGVGLMW